MAIPASISTFLQGKPHTVLSHPTAYTAQQEAAVTHVPGRYWAKTVVCFADDRPVLAVVPATCRVDVERLRRAMGAARLRLASEAEFEALYPDCQVGAMPPLGPLFHQPVFVDRIIAEDPEVVFHAGSHTDAIRMRYRDFAELVEPDRRRLRLRPGASAGIRGGFTDLLTRTARHC